MGSALIVTHDSWDRQTLSALLAPTHDVTAVTEVSLPRAIEESRGKRHDLLFIDLGLIEDAAEATGYDAYRSGMRPFWLDHAGLSIVAITPRDRIRDAAKAIRSGAATYVTSPVDRDEVLVELAWLQRHVRTSAELAYLREQFWCVDDKELVATKSPVMEEVLDELRAIAPTRTVVLLRGETGTGKGVAARLIHRHSERRDRPLITVHCGAIPDGLLESELFGHEKGAFTGAGKRKLGKFEVAHGGTIFLDEVGTISSAMQVKLLHVLQDGTIQRIGSEREATVDVRVIAATNADLEAEQRQGTFRQDLYYRLAVFPVELPPLRERREDIADLVGRFHRRLEARYGKGIERVHPLVIEALEAYDWPGNIRELENVMERAYILEPSDTLMPSSFPKVLQLGGSPSASPMPAAPSSSQASARTLAEVRSSAADRAEAQYLTDLLAHHEGTLVQAADRAGISYRQLARLLRKHGLGAAAIDQTETRPSSE